MKNGNSSGAAAARAIDVSQDLRAVQGYLRGRGLTDTLRELEKPAPALFGTLLAFEWTLIFAAMMLPLYVSPWLVPISLLILGSRQSALVIFLHDAAHKHICESRMANDIVARYALALPLFEDFATYRKEHTDHHRWLGHGGNDPDYVNPAWFRNIAPGRAGAAARIYLTLLRRNLNAGTRLRFDSFLWWSVFAFLLSCIVGVDNALAAVGLWVAARMTTYKAIGTFAELSDHTFVRGTSNLIYTRNVAYTWSLPRFLLVLLCYPYSDRFHLTHHLLPGVPAPRLKRAHTMLLGMEDYARSHAGSAYAPLSDEWTRLLRDRPDDTALMGSQVHCEPRAA
jgi:fatty acid desaturase